MTLSHKIHTELTYIPLDDTEKFFYNTDLALSGALVELGFELVSLDRTNPRKAVFIFSREKGLDETVSKYWSTDGLKVNARSYFDSIRLVKNRLYAA